MSTLNEQEINAAIMQYRNRCPDSYPDATATELICSVLWSAELFGRMAAKRNQMNKELLAALKEMLFIYSDQERGYDYFLGKHVPTILSTAKAVVAKAEGK